MPIIVNVLLGLALLGVGLFLLYYSASMVSNDEVAVRVQDLVVVEEASVDQQIDVATIETRDLAGSIISRVLVPTFSRVGDFIGRYTPAGALEKINRDLAIAGYPLGMGAREYYGLRMLLMVLGIALSLWLLFKYGVTTNMMGASLLMLLLMYLLPVSWLKNLVTKRQKSVSRGLPDALDMLSVCATAGLGFDQALQRVSEEWKTPVSEEFARVLSEMDLGISRQDALRSMEARLQISELSSFISVILQSEQLGMSIADTLQAQAEQMRIERRFRAQEIAQKMPAKMLFPLAFLILPAILAVLLGPSVPVFIDLFFNILG